ncbi:Cation-independent mannose-6-phosphate receptor CI-MPR [Sorochytrium milnesiophthora]
MPRLLGLCTVTLVVLFALLAWSPLAAAEDSAPCTLKVSDTELYDLRPLKITGDSSYSVDKASLKDASDSADRDSEFHLNVCAKVFSTESKDVENTGAYKKGADDKLISLGVFSEHVEKHQDHLEIRYKDGSPIDGRRRQTVIWFGTPQLLTDFDSTYYLFRWPTKYACSTSAGKSGGGGASVFWTIVLVLLLVYFAGGFVYNRFQGKRGREQVPHADFWFGLVGIVTGLFTACIDFVNKKRGASSPTSGGLSFNGDRYRNLPQHDDTHGFMAPGRPEEDDFEEQQP